MNIHQAQGATRADALRSAEKAGKRAMFMVLAGTSILGLFTIAVMGVVACKARLHAPKLNSRSQARNLEGQINPARPTSARSMIYTSDLYDVASRNGDGQVVKFQRTRHWHYEMEPLHSTPQPVAKVQAQARAARTNQTSRPHIPPRSTPPQRTSIQTAAS